MIKRLQIEKREADILCGQWEEIGAPVEMLFGRTRHGIVTILLEFDDTRRNEVEALIAETHKIYIEQLP